MKIRIRGNGCNLCIPVPTGLVFSDLSAHIATHLGRKYAFDAMQNIPPEAMAVLCAELRRIKRKHGSWELVNVESANGELVNITL